LQFVRKGTAVYFLTVALEGILKSADAQVEPVDFVCSSDRYQVARERIVDQVTAELRNSDLEVLSVLGM